MTLKSNVYLAVSYQRDYHFVHNLVKSSIDSSPKHS